MLIQENLHPISFDELIRPYSIDNLTNVSASEEHSPGGLCCSLIIHDILCDIEGIVHPCESSQTSINSPPIIIGLYILHSISTGIQRA